jgi:serine protease Do
MLTTISPISRFIAALALAGLLQSAPSQAQTARMYASQADLVAILLPSVVNISTVRYVDPVPVESSASRANAPAANQSAAGGRRRSLGSGFVIDASGIIATNRHVIEGAAEISVTFNDDTTLTATLLSKSSKGDVALLKVNPLQPLAPIRWADSDQLRPGDPVLAIGNPLGFGSSVSSGIVSALDRDIKASMYDDFIQTDATINHGNSGGPLFNLKGEVVGINTALFSTSSDGGSIGIGFTIPANDAKFIIGRLMQYGRVRPGWVGMQVQQVTADIAESVGLLRRTGVIVTGVEPNCPALLADVEEGDVVLSVAGTEIRDVRTLWRTVGIQPIDSTVPVVLWRNGADRTVNVVIGENPEDIRAAAEDAAAAAKASLRRNPPDLGLNLAALTPDARARVRLTADQRGVMVQAVSPSSIAAEQGLSPGDVILKVGRDPVSNPADVRARIDAARLKFDGRVLLLVQGPDRRQWYSLPAGIGLQPMPMRPGVTRARG